ncbi:MAG: flagellar basal body rod protein FlgC [Gammaproteobacteria bacterium]|nr:flagellar basal body rod protein FlgC [Gammaproteobacteria bacterium]
MALFDVFQAAGSGLNAQSVRLNATASNLANAQSVSGSAADAYRPRQPIFAAMLAELGETSSARGVEVLGIVESQRPPIQQYSPDHPLADEQGYIYKPNINIVEEMANMISASRSYQSNVEVMNTTKQLLIRTLSMGQ